MTKDYFIGLDIGTDSCGWAVTDTNYNILKAKGQKLWGVRFFDEAQDASARRLKRTNRRRLARKKLRLQWLREIFESEINKVDPLMLDRLKYSNLWEDDKVSKNVNLKSKDSLFNTTIDGKVFTDKQYFEDYPTIFHLRKELTQKPAKDIRLLYLAVHNIVKSRGHFLYEGDFEQDNDSQDITKSINEMIGVIMNLDSEIKNDDLSLAPIDEESKHEILSILKTNKGKRDTKLKFCEVLGANTKSSKAVAECLVDGNINLASIFKLEPSEDLKLKFNDENFDVNFANIESSLDNDVVVAVESLKKTYSAVQLAKLLDEHKYICDAMVARFDVHHNQLKDFKDFIKKYHRSQYFKIFRDAQETKDKGKNYVVNYPLYVNGDIYNGKKRVLGLNTSTRAKEEFYAFIKKSLDKPVEIENYDATEYIAKKQSILDAIEADNFLKLQRTKDNGVLPNKLYLRELKRILQVNADKYNFLNDKDETGLTNAEKIIAILTFRVPYFVGPIGGDPSAKDSHTWSIRDKSVDYKPWNLEKMIDYDASEDAFIQRMTNKCTYLPTQDVLPKHSILYSKYRVLNELNNLKIDGNKPSVELKQRIFADLFEKNAKVTINMIRRYFVSEGICTESEAKALTFSGIDKDFANNYSSYSRLATSHNFGKEFVDKNINMFENIILWHTIISDKNRLEARIKKHYSDILNEEQIKELKSLNFQGWGKMSRKFLQGLLFVNKKTGEMTTVINEMWNTQDNLQEILFNSNYDLQEKLEQQSIKQVQDITYNEVQELYCSPAVKRAVWQTIQIIKELSNTLGSKPTKIFVEVTRHDDEKGEKGRKLSRKDNLEKQYASAEFKKAIKNTEHDLESLMRELNKQDSLKLRSEKLYLYFMQLGRCAYSGEPINISDIFDNSLYDVDHIIPQSKLKDDSIDNKVLVKKECNAQKGDVFPIFAQHSDWVNKQKSFWGLLKKLNLMSEKKYSNLVRTDDLSEEEMAGFIARQLVETNQSAKAVIELLKSWLGKDTKIIYSKAKYVSEFRNKNEIYKSRTVNDLHHAKDAYLNIVVGNVLNSRFTDDPRNFYRVKNKNSNTTRNTKKLFDYNIYSHLTGELVWNGEADKKRIKDIVLKNDCIFSTMSYCNLNGAYYDETLYKKSKDLYQLKGDITNPISNPERYGGYKSLKIAYFVVIEGKKKGKIVKRIESIPTVLIQKYKNDTDRDNKILEYLATETGLEDINILVPKMNIKSEIEIGKGRYIVATANKGNVILHNNNQWLVDNEITDYVKTIDKYLELKKDKKIENLIESDGKVIISEASKSGNKERYLTKAQNVWLYNKILQQLRKSVYQDTALSSSLGKTIENLFDQFGNMLVIEQVEILIGIIKGLSTGAESAIINNKSVGNLFLGKNITGKDIYLIQKSVTGLYSKRIKL